MSSARIAAMALLLLTVASAWCLRSMRGIVTDQNGPAPGALVRFQGARDAVLTDSCVRFEPLPNLCKARRITAWRDGFAIGSATADSDPLTLRLLPLPPPHNSEPVG